MIDKDVGLFGRKSSASKTRDQFVILDTTIRDVITRTQFIKHLLDIILNVGWSALSYQFLQIGCDSQIS